MAIESWGDAGDWSSKGALAFTSTWKRMEAIRKAVLERKLLLKRTAPDIAGPIPPLASIKDWVDILTWHIGDLIPFFCDIRDNIITNVKMYNDSGDAGEFTAVSALESSETVTPIGNTGNMQLTAQDGILTFSAEETAEVSQLLNIPGQMSIRQYDYNDLLAEFPLKSPASDPFSSLSDWIWNAYQILCLLRHPAIYIQLGCNVLANISGKSKSLYIYTDSGGKAFFSYNGGANIETYNPSESAIWNSMAWVQASGSDTFASRSVITRTAGSLTITETNTVRHNVTSTCENLSRKAVPGEPGASYADVHLTYERAYTTYNTGNSFISDGYPPGQWIPLFDGVLPAGGTFDSSGTLPESLPVGTGSNTDRNRHRILSMQVDLNDTYGLKFLTPETPATA